MEHYGWTQQKVAHSLYKNWEKDHSYDRLEQMAAYVGDFLLQLDDECLHGRYYRYFAKKIPGLQLFCDDMRQSPELTRLLANQKGLWDTQEHSPAVIAF
jgi:hypothetical protein